MLGSLGGTIAVVAFVYAIDSLTTRVLVRRSGGHGDVTAGFGLAATDFRSRRGRRRLGAVALAVGGPVVALTLLPAGRDWVVVSSAVGVLAVVAALAVGCTGTLVSTPPSRAFSRRSLAARAIGDTALDLGWLLAVGLAAGAAATAAGSTDLEEIALSQKSIPSWLVLRQPLAAALFLVAALPAGAAPRAPALTRSARLATPAMRLRRTALAILGAHLFLGGWSSGGELPTGFAGDALATALLAVKAGVLAAALETARWRLPDLRADQSSRLCWRWIVPLALASFALSVLVAPAAGGSP